MAKKAKDVQSFDNVWDAIENTPIEAANMKLRAALMMALSERIKKEGLNQADYEWYLDTRRFGAVPYVDAVATVDEAGPEGNRGEMTVFAVNRSSAESMDVELRLGGYEAWTFLERIELAGAHPKAANTAKNDSAHRTSSPKNSNAWGKAWQMG